MSGNTATNENPIEEGQNKQLLINQFEIELYQVPSNSQYHVSPGTFFSSNFSQISTRYIYSGGRIRVGPSERNVTVLHGVHKELHRGMLQTADPVCLLSAPGWSDFSRVLKYSHGGILKSCVPFYGIFQHVLNYVRGPQCLSS